MKEQWKKTLIWLAVAAASLIFRMLPMFILVTFYSVIMFICHFAAALTVMVKRSIKPYIPFSVTAVIISAAVTLISASGITEAESTLMSASYMAIIIFTVPFTLGIATGAYTRGRKMQSDEGGDYNG